jgi:ribosomal protein S18 acetylase RimI-like enzyme
MQSPDLTLRVNLCRTDQQASLVDLLCEVHAYYNAGALISRDAVHEHLALHLLAAGSPHHLAVASGRDGVVLGLVAFTQAYSLVDFAPDKRKHCQLKELYVLAASRGQGVGKALMTWLARYALEHECHRIDWPVKADNARGIAFYRQLGAEQVKDRISFRLAEPQLSRLTQSSAPSKASQGLAGLLHRPGRPALALEAMDAAITLVVTERDAASKAEHS